jgi:hypothetical protein
MIFCAIAYQGESACSVHIREVRHLSPDAPLADQLAGRECELAAAYQLPGRGDRGHGQAVLIEGEPGIGKSTLVRAACAVATDRGCQVFWGSGDDLGQARPQLPILDGFRVCAPSANPRKETIVALLRGEVASGHGEDVFQRAHRAVDPGRP